jgi:hypothetical protein
MTPDAGRVLCSISNPGHLWLIFHSLTTRSFSLVTPDPLQRSNRHVPKSALSEIVLSVLGSQV